MSGATKKFTIEGRFSMHRGGYLETPMLAYETLGTLNDAQDNAIVIFSGLSPSAHAASSVDDPSPGWWEEIIGAGLPIDTDRFFVITVNSLGSCFGSAGPASINPETGESYRLNFPVLTLEDVAESTFAVVQSVGITRLQSVIGCSMGGMTALAFCASHPDAARSLVSISSTSQAEPFAIAVRSLQREMITSDRKWKDGNYDPEDPPIIGQRLARKLGMMTYRSPIEWVQRFGREAATPIDSENDDGFGMRYSVESYLENHARKFTGAFDANCYLYLSRASDLFDFAEHGGSLETAFKSLNLERALVIGVATDILFPLRQQRELADSLSAVCEDTTLIELDCIHGHDSFLVDMDAFQPVIRKFFQ